MQCLILAGGLGTRIRAVAGEVPKALIPVAGEPFAYHQLRWLARQGVRRVVYSIGYGGKQLRAAIGDGSVFGIQIEWCDEGDELRGTGGAVRLAVDLGMMDERFFLLYADSWLPIEIAPTWRRALVVGGDLMTVIRNEGRWDRSNAIYADGMVKLYDKNIASPETAGMAYTDYGLSVVLRQSVIDRIPPNVPYDIANMMTELSREGRLYGFEVDQRFYEIGSPNGLAEVQSLLAPPKTA